MRSINDVQASAGRNAFQLSNGALYSERDCSSTTFGNDADADFGDPTTEKSSTTSNGFKPKAKPQVSDQL